MAALGCKHANTVTHDTLWSAFSCRLAIDLTLFPIARMVDTNPLVPQDALLGGKYRLGPVIGSGGVATVYRATHVWTEREVAVKLLDPTLPHFKRLREGFLREARATVQLQHPNVVDVLVHRLRKKIDGDFDHKLIHTVRGMGYVLRVE